MRQFFDGDESAYGGLEERARRACVRFRRQEMPPGCDPPEADIGFEIEEASGTVRLLVTKNVRYRGANLSVREWLDAGAKSFPSFSAMTDWIRGTLREEFLTSAVTDRSPRPWEQGVATRQLTDMAAVHEGVRETHRPMYLDEQLLYEGLRRRVLGQEHALKALAGVMVRHCARVRPTRPAVVFAVGPSGVGKTRTAEMTARVLRDLDRENNGYQFMRLDMSEYQEAYRVSQLLGAPQGYVGHGEGSQLIDALRANPRTIVLFDEIEKAHAAIFRVLMNAMDAGRLSAASRSSGGREIDCRQAVFIFTSNVDAKEILDELDSRDAFGNRSVEDEVCRRRLHAAGVAPEIVGRIGRFLVYRPLSAETRAEIMALAIAEVAQEYDVQVGYIDPNVIIHLMEKIRSGNFGVRPERFLIDDALGGVFAGVASQGVEGPFQVTGPPFKCSPLVQADSQSRRSDKDSNPTNTAGEERA
jgi:hypothetical protein